MYFGELTGLSKRFVLTLKAIKLFDVQGVQSKFVCLLSRIEVAGAPTQLEVPKSGLFDFSQLVKCLFVFLLSWLCLLVKLVGSQKSFVKSEKF